MVSYLLKREYLASLYLNDATQPEYIGARLKHLQIGQVIWCGPPPAQFGQVSDLVPVKTVEGCHIFAVRM
jgi:hypothetical protein